MADPYATSLYLFSFFLLFFILTIGVSSEPLPVCYLSPSSCGDLTISYPFWNKHYDGSSDQNESYCGYSNFGIFCDHQNQSILISSNDRYYVKNIDYSTSTIDLVDIDLTSNRTCPTPKHNMTLRNTAPVLDNKDIVENITFYLDCTSFDPNITDIQCLQKDGGKQKSYMLRDEEIPSSGFDFNCSNVVVIPILKRNNLLLNDQTFGSVLNKGFQLEWNQLNTCGKCEASGGKCGHNHEKNAISKGFVCYCKNGTEYSEKCPKGNKKTSSIIGMAAGMGFFLLLSSFIFYLYFRKQQRRSSFLLSQSVSSHPSSMQDIEKYSSSYPMPVFTYNDLEEATNNFHESKELGSGGFGTVYLGKLRDGRSVAVKRLYQNNYKFVQQFMTEVNILSQLHHPNLVRLYGCTSQHSRGLLLVYEYVSNGTVADHLHGSCKNTPLSWSTRMSIAVETADALSYLHSQEPQIIHRDVKTNNILLDDHFRVKVADFGLSRLFPLDVTHVSTAPQGTPGYVDPEYHQCYQLTDRSDVYSFGVVLIELISSMPAVDITRKRNEINLSNMAIHKIQNDTLSELVDPDIGFNTDIRVRSMVTMVAELAFQCLQSQKEMRPTMREVWETLIKIKTEAFGSISDSDILDDDDEVCLKKRPQSPDTVIRGFDSRSTTAGESRFTTPDTSGTRGSF